MVLGIVKLQATGLCPTNFTDTYQWKVLQQHFSASATRHELLSIARILSTIMPLTKLPRMATRNTPCLVSWYIENWASIEPVLPYVHLYDDSYNEINLRNQCLSLKLPKP